MQGGISPIIRYLKGDEVTEGFVRQAITPETLAPLIEQCGERWNIWPSAQGAYACATLRRGLSWVSTEGRLPVGPGGAYVCSLITDSPGELRAAIEQENENISGLLADGTLRADV